MFISLPELEEQDLLPIIGKTAVSFKLMFILPPSKVSALSLCPPLPKEKLSLKTPPSPILQTPPKPSKNVENIKAEKGKRIKYEIEKAHPPLPWFCVDIGDVNGVADVAGGTGMDGGVDEHPVGDEDEGDGVGGNGRECLRWWCNEKGVVVVIGEDEGM